MADLFVNSTTIPEICARMAFTAGRPSSRDMDSASKKNDIEANRISQSREPHDEFLGNDRNANVRRP